MKMLDEAGEASAQAKQMGLISKGWGRWADPKTGKVTHKTDNNRLVSVDRKQKDKSGDGKELGPKPTSSKLGQIAKDLKAKAGRSSTKRQRAKAGADADVDAVEKLRQITDNPQDFEKASKMYHQGHDMKDIETQFGNKDKSKNTGNVTQDLDKKEPNFTRDTGPGESPAGGEANKQRIDSFLDKVSTVKNKDKAAKLIHNKIQHIDKQWTGVFDTTPKDPMYKNYGGADFEDDLYYLEKGYKKIVGKPYKAKDFADKPKNTGNVGMGSSPEKDRAKLRNKFLKKGTADAARAKRLGDTRPHAVKNLSDKDLEKRMNKISDYMDDVKADMRGATGSYKEKYEKATKDDREAYKIYHDEFEKRRKGKVGPKPGAQSDPSALNVKGDKANKLKRAQSLRQAWKQKGNAEAQATFARDFPKQYALDVASQQGKDLASKISRDMKGKGPEWKKQAAAQLKQHKARVEKIRSMDDDTQFKGDMDQRRSELDKLRGDGDDTVSGMSGKRARIVRR
jgi:hypothetical protein